jgi:hypothetical protein
MKQCPSATDCCALGLLVVTVVAAVGLSGCAPAVENKQVNKPIRPIEAIMAPVVHVPTGLKFPPNIVGWMRSPVSAQQALQPRLRMSYNSGRRRLGESDYAQEQTATVDVFPAGGKSVEDVVELMVNKVLAKHPGGERTTLKSAVGTSVRVKYFNAKNGWHMGREVCVVKHKEYVLVYQILGSVGRDDSGYSQVEHLTGVIHGLKK